MRQRLLLAIVGLTLVLGTFAATSATDTATPVATSERHAATIAAGHEANVTSPAATGARERRIGLLGALFGFLTLAAAGVSAATTGPSALARARRERAFVRRRGPPSQLVLV